MILVRSERAPASLIRDLRTVLRRIDPQLPIADVRTMDEIVDAALRQQHVTAVLIGGFSLGASPSVWRP